MAGGNLLKSVPVCIGGYGLGASNLLWARTIDLSGFFCTEGCLVGGMHGRVDLIALY